MEDVMAQNLSDASTAPQTKRTPANSVCLVVHRRRKMFLLQLREDKPEVGCPGMWGLFGGAVDPGETKSDALCREIMEEIALDASPAQELFHMTWARTEKQADQRTFFVQEVSDGEAANLVLNEGEAMRWFTEEEVFSGLNMLPIDQFALFLLTERHNHISLRTGMEWPTS